MAYTNGSLVKSVDWLTICIYLALIVLGWISVCGASYDFEQGSQLLDFSARSGMQMVWIVTSLMLGGLILCVDDRLVESLSYIIYIEFLALLFVTPMLAHDIKGSLSSVSYTHLTLPTILRV